MKNKQQNKRNKKRKKQKPQGPDIEKYLFLYFLKFFIKIDGLQGIKTSNRTRNNYLLIFTEIETEI